MLASISGKIEKLLHITVWTMTRFVSMCMIPILLGLLLMQMATTMVSLLSMLIAQAPQIGVLILILPWCGFLGSIVDKVVCTVRHAYQVLRIEYLSDPSSKSCIVMGMM